MNGNHASIEDLNARRRQAVRLRLQGEKLAVVSASTGLSTPTVIAAVKAFRQGGWSAVEVSPRRGRPPKEQEGFHPDDLHGVVQAMLAGPPELCGLTHTLWSRKALGDWLGTHGNSPHSAGSVTKLCQHLGLDFDEGDLGSPETSTQAHRYHGMERYLPAWPGVPADSARIGVLCIRAARRQLLWLAFSAPLEARHYQLLLSRLVPQHGVLELAIP